ncbi:hypothetical protein [Streptomyces sp. NPDC058252]|uniref:hypothetical protein n=1 Tax=Streptomyces sp. NPDC058252 TaxID=3346405 RepID=UPI0036E08B3F
MDAKATARYIERTIDEAVKEAQEARNDFAELMTGVPINVGSSMVSPHVLDALINAEATAMAFLEIRSGAKGTLEQVGTDAFLDAVRQERVKILRWLRTSRLENTGIVQVQMTARHNAATKVLARTDVIEIIDEEN